MKQYAVVFLLVISGVFSNAQVFKYYRSNAPKFLKGTDTLLTPFTGGVNAPQFSTIDLNGDGHKDLFVFDRATSRVLCYLNTTNGYQHAPQYEHQFPYMRGWVLLRDFNGDGKEDIWTVPLNDRRYSFDTITNPGMNPQNMRILVQRDDVFGFKQIGQMVRDTGKSYLGFPPTVPETYNIAPEDILINSLDIPGLEDMDEDGDIDVLAFHSEDLSPTYYENYKTNPHQIVYPKDSTRFIYRDKCWGGIHYDVGVRYNHFIIHKSKNDLLMCTYRLYEKRQQMHIGTTTLLLDVNQDGVKDMIYGDATYPNLIALINGRSSHPQHQDSIVSQDSIFPKNTTPFNHIMGPAAYYVDADLDGLNDLLVTTNNTKTVKNVNNVWVYKNGGTQTSPVFNYLGNSFFLFDQTLDFGSRTVPVVIDMNGDGKKDLLVATSGDYAQTFNSRDQLVYYHNVGSNQAPVYQLVDSNFLRLTDGFQIAEMHPTFGDLNGDGKQDLVVGGDNGKLIYYEQTGSLTVPAYTLRTQELGGIDVGNSSAPQLYDLNKDGLLDLIIGNRAGIVKYFKNKGNATTPMFTSTATIDSLGGIVTRDFYLSALGYEYSDNDGYATPQICELDGNPATLELATGMWNGKVLIYTGVSDVPGAIFVKKDSLFALTPEADRFSIRFGSRSVPFATNMDDDDRLDLLIGNMGGGLNFYASIPAPTDSTKIGLGEIKFGKINVYPNPAANEVNFDTYLLKENMQYEVVDIMGRQLLKGNVNHYYGSITINTEMLVPGIYFLKLQGSTQGFVSRFMISQ